MLDPAREDMSMLIDKCQLKSFKYFKRSLCAVLRCTEMEDRRRGVMKIQDCIGDLEGLTPAKSCQVED